MIQNHDPRVNEQALAEQNKRAKRERDAEKRRKKTRDKHRAQGLEHTREYRCGRRSGQFKNGRWWYSRKVAPLTPNSIHFTSQYANNRAEVSHEHTRAQERQMRRFKSPGQVQRFLVVHSQVHNLFRVGRHLLRSANYRMLRSRSFETWRQVTCAC